MIRKTQVLISILKITRRITDPFKFQKKRLFSLEGSLFFMHAHYLFIDAVIPYTSSAMPICQFLFSFAAYEKTATHIDYQ